MGSREIGSDWRCCQNVLWRCQLKEGRQTGDARIRSELLEATLDVVVDLGEVLLGRLCGGPADTETLLLVRLGDDVDCDMLGVERCSVKVSGDVLNS